MKAMKFMKVAQPMKVMKGKKKADKKAGKKGHKKDKHDENDKKAGKKGQKKDKNDENGEKITNALALTRDNLKKLEGKGDAELDKFLSQLTSNQQMALWKRLLAFDMFLLF